MSDAPVLVNVQRVTAITPNGQGGRIETLTTVYSQISALQRLYRKTSEQRIEEGTHNAEGPGVATLTRNLFVFETAPFPNIKVNDLIVDPASISWRVHFVRQYEINLQVDTEVTL